MSPIPRAAFPIFPLSTELEQKGKALDVALTYFFRPIRPDLLEMELDARSRAIDLIGKLKSLLEKPRLYEDARVNFDRLEKGEIPIDEWPGSIDTVPDR